jgi:uncharacterized protein (TIGR02679 family)
MNLQPLEPLRSVLAQVRAALEARGVDRARSLTLDDVPEAQRRALAGLFGWREVPSTPKVRLSLDRLDATLRESTVGKGLVEVLTAMFGPLADHRAEKAKLLAARGAIWERARDRVAARPALLSWLDDMRAHGRAARAATLSDTSEEAILDEALAVVSQLPASGTLLPVFALEALGDAHALDAGRPLSPLVLRAAAALMGTAPPANAMERRRLWADVGVACDSLSADVLSLGLRPQGDDMLARHLREAAAQGEPRRTTLRELSHGKLRVARGSVVFICENPSIVAAAAEHLGPNAQALVCVEGVPSTAALRLLEELSESGAELRFHVDFDWGGVRIGNRLLEQVPNAAPWRLNAADYERSLAAKRGTLELVGSSADARWDVELRSTMSRHSLAVLEEQVVGDLLDDLAV